jgi:hypothetical protein
MRNARSKGGMHGGSAFHLYFSAISRACARCVARRQDSINQEAAVRPLRYGEDVAHVQRWIERGVAKTEANAWRAISACRAVGANLARMFLDAQKRHQKEARRPG